ncbi:hypothetical protein EZS27_036761, partial [termite gut metagenome]
MRINMYFYGKNAMIHINFKEDDVQLLAEGRYTQA